MSLQEDINQLVALIHSRLASAGVAAGQIVSTPVDLSPQIAAIPDQQPIDFSAVVSALTAAADQIDALGGDSSALRAAAGGVNDQSVDLSTVKAALTESGSKMGAISENLDRAARATGDHLEGAATMTSLLIDQSNYGGSEVS
jgi:hypothetical protein